MANSSWLRFSVVFSLVLMACGRTLMNRHTMRQVANCQGRTIDLHVHEEAKKEILDLLETGNWALKNIAGDEEVWQEVRGDVPILGGILTINKEDDRISVFGKTHDVCDFATVELVQISEDDAIDIAKNYEGSKPEEGIDELEYHALLFLDPVSMKYVYIVQEKSVMHWAIIWVEAAHGRNVIHAYDNLNPGIGFGVFNDRRDMSELSTPKDPYFYMTSIDKRQMILDCQYSADSMWFAVDADNLWETPYQAVQVDLQFWLRKLDKYLLNRLNFDYVVNIGYPLTGVVHIQRNLSNAYWNLPYLIFGEAEGSQDLNPLSADESIVSHEVGHAVTSAFSDLMYVDYSGALNEAFSDIFAIGFLHYLAPHEQLSWKIGEKVTKSGEGIRSFSNPEEGRGRGQPSHIDDVNYIGERHDNGGVHYNSGVVNHWFYLLVEGGQNAKEERRSGREVQSVGIQNGLDIAFKAFMGLSEDSDFCDARVATVNVASMHSLEENVKMAWDEVGVTESFCGIVPKDGENLPSDPVNEDPCHGLCGSDGVCTGTGLGTGNARHYCLYCNTFTRSNSNGENYECCTHTEGDNICSINESLPRHDRCKVQHNGIMANGVAIDTDQFANAKGPVCYKLSNFKLHHGMCKIIDKNGGWVCDFAEAMAEALKALELDEDQSMLAFSFAEDYFMDP